MDELLNKYETAKRVNHLIAEETKNINQDSSPNEMYQTIRTLRTEIGEAIKDFPTIKTFERETYIGPNGRCEICGANLNEIFESKNCAKDISYCWSCGRKIDKRRILKLYDKPFTTIEDLSDKFDCDLVNCYLIYIKDYKLIFDKIEDDNRNSIINELMTNSDYYGLIDFDNKNIISFDKNKYFLSEIAVATFYDGITKTLNVFVPYVFDEKSCEKLMLCKTDIENMTEDFSCEN